MSQNNHISRRKFLGTASCAAVGSITMLSSLASLKAASTLADPRYRMASAPQNDYKALVCILLAGGMDSFNMLIPTDQAAYNSYTKTRSNQALAKKDLLSLNPTNTNIGLGLHPAMPEVQRMFHEGDLAFVNNVGTLVERVPSVAAFQQGLSKLPLGLFSHADQMQQWQTSVPQERLGIGWGGRMADLMHTSNTSQDISMSISLAGNNVFQSGSTVVPYTISPYTGSSSIRGYEGTGVIDQIRTTAVKGLLEQQYQDIFKQSYADVLTGAQSSHERFSQALSSTKLTTTFTNNFVSQSMHKVAQTIAARNVLGMRRQIFFITFGGWDHHDELTNNLNGMLGILSVAMGEFQAAMREIGIDQDVTTFTISDFARTLTSNGNGTDHAWGGNMMVMGGAVKGQKMYGTYPDLALRNPLDVGEGVLIPTTSTDEYFAELAMWLGVAPSDLPFVLPNVGNFYDRNSGTPPLGFLL